MTDPFARPVNPMHSQMSPEQREEIQKIQVAIDHKVLAVFNSPEGDVLLDAWDDIFTRQQVWVPNAPEGFAAFREGQNDLVRKIRATVNRARGQK
jgi:hypothetical protein